MAKRGRPVLYRTEPLYLRIDPELKAALYRIQEDITPEVGKVSLTDVVTHLLREGIKKHDEVKKHQNEDKRL